MFAVWRLLLRPVLSIFQRVVSCGSVLGLLALGACASTPDVAPKSAAQQPPAITPATDKPTSTLSRAPGAANGGVLGPGQLIPGLAQNNLPPIEIMPSRPSPDANGLVRVGLLVPLSGASAPVGTALLNAAQMALFDVADDRFVLQAYDTKGTPEGAAAASNMALSHGVQLILGPLFSAEAKAIAPQANAAGVNVVTFSTDPAIAGPRVFVMGFLVQEQVRQIVNYARNEGHKRFAVLAPDSAYGQSVVEAFQQMVPARGGEIAHVAFYQADGKNLSDVVKRLGAYDERQQALALQKAELAGKQDEISQLALKRLEMLDTIGEVDFDAILLPDQGARLTQAASLLPFYDIDPGRVQLFGTLLWNTPGLGRESALVGGIYPAPPAESTGQFFARYRDLYGQGAPSIATHGYDAVALAAVLARSAPTNAFTAEGITAATGFAGIDGIFRFLPSGLSQRGFAIMQVTREGAIQLQPGPATFETNAQF
jgi:branched-chain amino acid transport system substrate-binding protein